MSTIYELNHEMQDILHELEWEDDEENVLKDRLSAIKGTVVHKLEFLSTMLAEAIAQRELAEEAINIAKKRLESNEKRKKASETKLRKFILNAMKDFEIEKIEGNVLSMSTYKRNVVVYDENIILENVPKDLLKVAYALNKTEITKLLKAGECLPFAYVEEVTSLRVS